MCLCVGGRVGVGKMWLIQVNGVRLYWDVRGCTSDLHLAAASHRHVSFSSTPSSLEGSPVELTKGAGGGSQIHEYSQLYIRWRGSLHFAFPEEKKTSISLHLCFCIVVFI